MGFCSLSWICIGWFFFTSWGIFGYWTVSFYCKIPGASIHKLDLFFCVTCFRMGIPSQFSPPFGRILLQLVPSISLANPSYDQVSPSWNLKKNTVTSCPSECFAEKNTPVIKHSWLENGCGLSEDVFRMKNMGMSFQQSLCDRLPECTCARV